jgi:hypothetical protein
MNEKGLVFPGSEWKLVFPHIDTFAAEPHAFHFQARALFQATVVAELDLASGPYHAVPRQGIPCLSKHLDHLPVVQRVSCGGRHLAVSSNSAARDLADHLAHCRLPLLVPGSAQKTPRYFGVGEFPHGADRSSSFSTVSARHPGASIDSKESPFQNSRHGTQCSGTVTRSSVTARVMT